MEVMFEGVGVALITPFNLDNSIDYKSLEKLINYQIDRGVSYLVALGTTAETATLTIDEQEQLVEFIVDKVAARVPLMLGIGGNNTQQLVDRIKQTNFAGVEGLLSATPYYNKPQQAGLVAHYKQVCDASPVPLILYNVPSRTGVNLSAESTIELARYSENIIAIKEASGNIEQMSAIVRDMPTGFSLISGDDSIVLPVLAIGGSGVISVLANALPFEFAELIRKFKENELEQARKLHLQLLRISQLIFAEGNPSGIKELLRLKGIITNSNLRLPLTKASEQLSNLLKEELGQLAINSNY